MVSFFTLDFIDVFDVTLQFLAFPKILAHVRVFFDIQFKMIKLTPYSEFNKSKQLQAFN